MERAAPIRQPYRPEAVISRTTPEPVSGRPRRAPAAAPAGEAAAEPVAAPGPASATRTGVAAPPAVAGAGSAARDRAVWAPPVFAACAVGLWGIGRGGSLWRDESVTVQVAHRPLGDLLGLLGEVDAVHGLYYLLMHGVFALWDGGPTALRLPSVLGSALAAAGVAATGRLLAGPRAGLTAGLLYAVLPPLQMYAQEGRSYALVAAAVVWSGYFLLRARWTAYVLVLGLGCWLHEFAALALLAHACGAWRIRAWRWSAALVLALVAPLAVVSARQAQAQLGWLGPPSWADWTAYGTVAGCGLLLARRADRGVARAALPLLLVPPGVLLVLSRAVHPWYVDRYVLYALAGLVLLAAARPWRWWAALLLALLVLPWSWWLRTPDSRKDDAPAAARAVRELARPGDAVLFLPARRREWLLSSPAVHASLDDVALDRTPAASRTLQGTERPAADVRAAMLAAPRIVALSDPPDQPLDAVPAEAVKRRTLAADFELCAVVEVRGARVSLYARPGTCP
ncbi:hypothetical protein [Streptomyces sp. NBC_00239]|uniref:hypothetical protein n=1 Tax=Streptomyces sp. NBC_00239 TaxID=2903640 RepID=UPI002E2CA69D|nr:hypothetical protein [Streptomyces sp. NBC_00239]